MWRFPGYAQNILWYFILNYSTKDWGTISFHDFHCMRRWSGMPESEYRLFHMWRGNVLYRKEKVPPLSVPVLAPLVLGEYYTSYRQYINFYMALNNIRPAQDYYKAKHDQNLIIIHEEHLCILISDFKVGCKIRRLKTLKCFWLLKGKISKDLELWNNTTHIIFARQSIFTFTYIPCSIVNLTKKRLFANHKKQFANRKRMITAF